MLDRAGIRPGIHVEIAASAELRQSAGDLLRERLEVLRRRTIGPADEDAHS